MKRQKKRLSLNEAAKRMGSLTQKYLDRLSPVERGKRLKAFQAVVAKTASLSQKDPFDTPVLFSYSLKLLIKV